MRITNVEPLVLGNPWKAWFFVLVHTDEGIVGIGEGEGWTFAQASVAFVEQNKESLFVGRDPFRIERLVRDTQLKLYERWGYGPVTMGALAAVETACFDIMGKALRVPASTFFGGRVFDRLRVYANGWYTRVSHPAEWAAKAAEIVGLGYTALKFDPFGSAYRHLPSGGLKRAIAIVEAVRTEVGDGVDLIIEGHGRFSIAEAVEIGRAITPYRPRWFEAPIHNFLGPESHLQLKSKIDIPIATDLAGIKDRYEAADFCRMQAVDVFQPDFRDNGGVLETKFMAQLAETYAIDYAPHQANGPVGTAIYAQLNSTCTNFVMQEHFEPFASPPWLLEVFEGVPLASPDGLLNVPDRPGWGIEIDITAAKKYPQYNARGEIDLFQPGWERRSFK
jgi:galactonate dehydratase